MIRVEVDGGVARVALARAEKRNALTVEMLHDLAAFAEAHDREMAGVRAVLLTGDGESFCAGFDLTLCREDRGAMGALLRGLSLAMRGLRRMPVPVVVSAHGAAIAGGCALLGGADVVMTEANAKLGYPVVRLGVSPAVTSPMLVQSMGYGGSRRRLLDPQLFSGADAVREGLAHFCEVDADAARARAEEIALHLAAKPAHSVRVTKQWMNDVDGSACDHDLDAALAASLSLAGGDEEQRRLETLWKKG